MAARSAISSELADRCDRIIVEGTWVMVERGPRARRRDWPGATAVTNAVPSGLTNTLYVLRAEMDLPRLLAEAKAFFGPSVPWRVMANSATADTVRRAAEGLKFVSVEVLPGMILDPIPPAPRSPAELTIREVSSVTELKDFGRTGGIGFGIPPWVLRVALGRGLPTATSSDGRARYFVGRAAGRPVATSAVYESGGVAGIFLVATVPDARRRGYGEAMTWAALDAARRDGHGVGYLQATEMGRSVYEKMGFRWTSDYPEWHGKFPASRAVVAAGRMMWYGLTRWT